MLSKQFWRWTLPMAGLCWLGAGCLIGPDYDPPDASAWLTNDFKHTLAWKQAEPKDDLPRGSWWDLFGDDRLADLVELATTNEPGVRAAFFRVEQARALVRMGDSALYPEISFDGSAQRSRRSATTGSTVNSQRGRTTTTLRFPFAMTYELDLWGRLRRGLQAAEAEAMASEADHYNVLLALQTDLAANYYRLAGLDSEIEVLQQGVALRQRNYELIEKRFQAGDVDALDMSRAETEWESARSELLDLHRRRALAEHAVVLLTGRPPAAADLAVQPLEDLPPGVPSVLPSSLLERRPDVASAERAMAAANARIGQAQAAWFPEVRLNGSIGYESSELNDLFQWPSHIWGFGPSVQIPLFEGGRIRAEVDRQRQRYWETVELYRGRILTALREVEDAVADLHWLARQAQAQEKTVQAARRTVDLAQRRYDAGLVSYFDVVDAQRTELENRQLSVRIQSARFVATVQLIKALGGDWRDLNDTTNRPPTPEG